MKLWLAASPLLVLALWSAIRGLQGKLSRRSLNVAVALVLLVYTLTTASLGVFWVARMDLPVFDWHYLFGYGLLVTLAVHVALQLQGLSIYFRRASPAWLVSADRSRFRLPVRALAWIALSAVALAPALAWLVGRASPRDRVRIASGPRPGPAGSAALPANEVWIDRGGQRMSVADYLWGESRHERGGLLRRPGVSPPRPALVRRAGLGESLALPRAGGGERRTDRAGGARAVSGPQVDLATLAELLHHTYGVTRRAGDDLSLRAAASAGALYPIDLFVIARDAAPGLQYYDPEAHGLRAVGGADAAARALSALPAGSSARGAPLVVLLGATFDRTVFKYEARSYRYIGLDAGHVAHNLVVASAALGLDCVLEPWFDDAALSSALELADDGEGAVLAAGCGAGSRRAATPVPAFEPAPLPDAVDDAQLTRLSHRLTSIRLRDGSSAEVASHHVDPPRYPDPFALLRSRRSVRAFAPTAASRGELDAVLAAAREALGALGRPSLIELYAIVRAVDGVAAGSYRATEELELLRSDPTASAKLQSAGLDQEALGRSAFVVVLSLAGVDRADGPRAFRHALVQAGLASEAVYLESGSLGLGACAVGAFFDDEVRGLVAPDARPVHLVAVGKR